MDQRNPQRYPAPLHTFPFPQMFEHSQQQQVHSEDEESSGNKEMPAHHTLGLHPQVQMNPKSSSQPTGTSGEVVAPARKPRGRPPGSKNKPKPPIIINNDSGMGMFPHVLEIAPNTDILEAISSFSRRKQRSVCVISGRGAVTNLTLLKTHQRHPSPPHSSSSPPPASASSSSTQTITYQGRYEILSLSGAFLQQMQMQMPNAGIPFMSSLTISVFGGNGQVIGGNVAGPLVSASPVCVIVASFSGASYERLPVEEGEHQTPQHQPVAPIQNSPPSVPYHQQMMNDPFGTYAGAVHHVPAHIPQDYLGTWPPRPPM